MGGKEQYGLRPRLIPNRDVIQARTNGWFTPTSCTMTGYSLALNRLTFPS